MHARPPTASPTPPAPCPTRHSTFHQARWLCFFTQLQATPNGHPSPNVGFVSHSQSATKPPAPTRCCSPRYPILPEFGFVSHTRSSIAKSLSVRRLATGLPPFGFVCTACRPDCPHRPASIRNCWVGFVSHGHPFRINATFCVSLHRKRRSRRCAGDARYCVSTRMDSHSSGDWLCFARQVAGDRRPSGSHDWSRPNLFGATLFAARYSVVRLEYMRQDCLSSEIYLYGGFFLTAKPLLRRDVLTHRRRDAEMRR